jgi:outer membrane protein insertion porin family
VRVAIDRGPLVVVAFTGDPLPEADRDRLVPVRTEGSADEDLLEDANAAIEEYLHVRGYRDADVRYTREQRDGELRITFTIKQGRRHVVEAVAVDGNRAIPAATLLELLRLKEGDLFVQATLDAGADAIRGEYRSRGYTRPAVQASVTELPPGSGGSAADDRVRVRVAIAEGPRTLVGTLAFEGNTVFTDEQLGALMTTATDRPYTQFDIVSDRDRIELEYLNRGYESIVVTPTTTFSEDATRVDIEVSISEGMQVIVDHVIVLGNERTSTQTIERELLLKPGEPLGYSARIESQQRLAALGLFRRVTIEEVRHTGQPRRDVIVQVVEAQPTTIGVGGGVEGGTRLRPTGEGGQAEERFEVVPHGFFEVGRRNLWGKNRSVNLFTRVSLRSRDIVLSSGGIRFERPAEGSGYGFNEYRVLGTFREPRIFNTAADVLVTGILDQAIRSSFNFITREARAEAGFRLTDRYSMAGRYSYKHTRLFDEVFTAAEKPLIDRIFPEVRLSKFSGSAIRDSRNDPIDPERGSFVILDGQLAARAIGSEVGFVKTFIQGFTYHRMPAARRTVLAFGARLGAAHGFPRAVPRVTPDGQPVLGPDGNPVIDLVQDLPASERFFAGGDTTVRGFSLDRLGTEETISVTGFPTGGNGLVVLNTELRVALVGGLGAIGFVDAGNVFLRATDIDPGEFRATTGFGVSYRSPIGLIRVDLGFKLDRRELVPGVFERRSEWHVSLGQPF